MLVQIFNNRICSPCRVEAPACESTQHPSFHVLACPRCTFTDETTREKRKPSRPSNLLHLSATYGVTGGECVDLTQATRLQLHFCRVMSRYWDWGRRTVHDCGDCGTARVAFRGTWARRRWTQRSTGRSASRESIGRPSAPSAAAYAGADRHSLLEGPVPCVIVTHRAISLFSCRSTRSVGGCPVRLLEGSEGGEISEILV